MNWSLGHFSSNAFWSSISAALDLVAVAEHLVEREQRRGQAAAAAEEVAAADALALGGLLADVVQPRLVLLLLRRLVRRDELLVRGDAGRDRQWGVGVRVEVALADPHGSRLLGRGRSCRRVV